MLKPAGLDKSVGLITVGYLKDPTDPQWKNDPAMQEWRAFMEKYYPDGRPDRQRATSTATSSRRRMVQVLKQCGDDLTRENVMKPGGEH